MQYAATRPTYLLDGLIAKSELRELLDILYDELEATSLGLLGPGSYIRASVPFV